MQNKSKSIAENFVAELIEARLTVSCAESMTGGLIASEITSVPGSSNVISSSFVTYSEDSKMKLVGVKKATLEKYSVYSEEVALEMAIGARLFGESAIGIGVTGVAGPSGGTDKCKVGEVFIAAVYKDKAFVQKFAFNGNRNENRKLAAQKALEMALKIIQSN